MTETIKWNSADTPPDKSGRYLIQDSAGVDEAMYYRGKWKTTDKPKVSTSPYLKSRFRADMHDVKYWAKYPKGIN